jgi:hypothetical protein
VRILKEAEAVPWVDRWAHQLFQPSLDGEAPKIDKVNVFKEAVAFLAV